jgi:dTDP-4-amino-4,6-dideoxygalactose transaminase
MKLSRNQKEPTSLHQSDATMHVHPSLDVRCRETAIRAEQPTIPVTRPFLPPLNEFTPYLEKIWRSKILTNGGHFHNQLERALCQYLGLNHVSLLSNGTTALMTALQALRITGEVITTPYSFVATANSILWNRLTPVFVDIDPTTLNIDPTKIPSAITARTSAILAVHCYGNPCDSRALQRIADSHNLKIIYDAAHCFGVADEGGSILRHGDLSVLSFHATKVFNTFEGGAVICPDAAMKARVDNLKNFGFVDETTVSSPGINGKMAEINAAFGLLQLGYIDQLLIQRKEIDSAYRALLADIDVVSPIDTTLIPKYNYSYFPVLVAPRLSSMRDELYFALRAEQILARRYFFPLISAFPAYAGFWSARTENLPIAHDIANRILCLPIYPGLKKSTLKRIVNVIRKWASNKRASRPRCRMLNRRPQNSLKGYVEPQHAVIKDFQ